MLLPNKAVEISLPAGEKQNRTGSQDLQTVGYKLLLFFINEKNKQTK